jgi:hypothetical protein
VGRDPVQRDTVESSLVANGHAQRGVGLADNFDRGPALDRQGDRLVVDADHPDPEVRPLGQQPRDAR